MILDIGAAYWPDADEVVIDTFTTENDGITPSVPDALHLDLLVQTTDLNGTKTLRPLNTLDVAAIPDLVTADSHFKIRFRAPQRRQDLWLTVTATFGVTPVTKTVPVGLSHSEHTQMDLPDNEIFTQDVLDIIQTGGPHDQIMPDNKVILAEPIFTYNETFIFSSPQPVETYQDLQYTGGAIDRLLLSSQTNSYQIQEDLAPWAIPAFLFLESAQTNLMTNSFLLTQTNNIPQTWTPDGSGAVTTAVLDFDHQTSSDAKVWAVRFRQNNIYLNSFAMASLICSQSIPVTGGQQYCFSSYLRTRLMTPDTVVKNIRMRIAWFNGLAPLSDTDQALSTANFSTLSLAACVGTAPLSATAAQVRFDFYDVDAGDDIECSIFAPQFESGQFATTRTLATRLADQVTTQPYNAANQKIRFQFIPGFGNAALTAPLALTSGPLQIVFDNTGIHATLTGGPTLSAAEFFLPGDHIDLTVSHLSNGKFTIYLDGVVVAQQALGVIAPTAAPIQILGIGIELLQLNVFSRS